MEGERRFRGRGRGNLAQRIFAVGENQESGRVRGRAMPWGTGSCKKWEVRRKARRGRGERGCATTGGQHERRERAQDRRRLTCASSMPCRHSDVVDDPTPICSSAHGSACGGAHSRSFCTQSMRVGCSSCPMLHMAPT